MISAYEARTKFGKFLNPVYYKDTKVVVEKTGKPMVKINKVSKPNELTLSPI